MESLAGERIVTVDGTVYTLTGEVYGPRDFLDGSASSFEGAPNRREWLYRTDAKTWVYAIAKLDRFGGYQERTLHKISDREVKNFLTKLEKTDVLWAYGLAKQETDEVEKPNREVNDSLLRENDILKRLDEKTVAKFRDVRKSLVRVVDRLDNQPHEKEELEDCIRELEAIEKLGECQKLDKIWHIAIKQAIEKLTKLAKRIGDQWIIDKINDIVRLLF